MKNQDGEVIYVGKAKNLKNRVVSYFNNSSKSPKTQILVSHIREFEFIITESDAESFVLENNLIKEYRPKYNIRLKDDKSYPYVKINRGHDFPRIKFVRRPKKQKNVELFGPFPTGSGIGNIIKIITKSFKLRDCSSREFSLRKTPCLLYQMDQCSAPCVNLISEEDYAANFELALGFFRGKRKAKTALTYLVQTMLNLAEHEQFEQAAILRDQVEHLKTFMEQSYVQNVEFLDDQNIDILAYYQGENEVDISLYMIRQGVLLGHKNFNFSNSDMWEGLEDEVILYMLQYYSQFDEIIPDKIITSLNKEFNQTFHHALTKINCESAPIKVESKTKKYLSLLESTEDHARENQRVRIENEDSVYVGLHKLKDLLNLKDRPRTLECYDIAIWQGKSPTASQIVFHDGKADKKAYRYYHLQELPEGNNDFAMMKEVFERRLKHKNFPDVFIVDGGTGQVNIVTAVLKELEIDIPVVGIAKSRDLNTGNYRSTEASKSDERLVIPGRMNPYILSKCTSLFRIVVQMRDEAHRFSRKLHHKAEHKRIIRSWVEDVPGLNSKVKNQILTSLTQSVGELKGYNIKKIQDYFGISEKHARALYNYLHAKTKK